MINYYFKCPHTSNLLVNSIIPGSELQNKSAAKNILCSCSTITLPSKALPTLHGAAHVTLLLD